MQAIPFVWFFEKRTFFLGNITSQGGKEDCVVTHNGSFDLTPVAGTSTQTQVYTTSGNVYRIDYIAGSNCYYLTLMCIKCWQLAL